MDCIFLSLSDPKTRIDMSPIGLHGGRIFPQNREALEAAGQRVECKKQKRPADLALVQRKRTPEYLFSLIDL